MQADYKILPRRNGTSDGSFSKLHPIKFFTNYYEISIDSNKSKIYQYSFSLPEDIPQDSSLYQKAIGSIKKSLKSKIGYITHSGQMIWGSVELTVPTTFECKFQLDQHKYAFESVVKCTKTLDLRDLDQEKTRPIYLQILNVDLKNSLKSLRLCQLGKRGQYFQREILGSEELDQMGLQVLKGYRFTLVALNSGIYLQVDVCSRVLQSRNLLEMFNGRPLDQNKEKYEGQTVITKYGTYRTYKIQEIDHKKSPLSTFYHEKKGCDISYEEYYRDVYGIKIRNIKQPLLKAIKSVKKQLTKGGKSIEQVKQIVYLVPQLVSPTGMTDEQRKQHKTMQALAKFTNLDPYSRTKQCSRIVEDLNNVRGLISIKNPKRLEGYCLPKPDIEYSEGTVMQPDNSGNLKNRSALKEPFFFKDWVFVYSIRKGNQDDEEADNAVRTLKKASEVYGIKFNDPGFITVNSANVEDWQYQIQKDVEKNGAPQIIVLFLAGAHEQKHYGFLKKFLTNQVKCPSQFIKRRTLGNPKSALSAASKISIQMNVKVGATAWEVKKRHKYFSGKNIMYGGISISKAKKGGNTLAFVGTGNSECTKVYSQCKVGIKSKENISVQILEDMFVRWAKNFFMSNKKAPDVIMLYREGLSIPQIKDQLPRMEIPALENMVKKIGQKTNIKNYKPQIIVIIANKKINTRYFAAKNDNIQNNPLKFIPQLFNPDSGSIMVESLSSDDSYDFHLAAQYVSKGTCTPTLFRVAYDTSKMPQEALIHFTFEQCFNYYNWQGAVRVPACLQNADKLSKLAGQSIKEDIVQSTLSKKLFFL